MILLIRNKSGPYRFLLHIKSKIFKILISVFELPHITAHSKERYGLFRELFARNRPLNEEERNVLEQCNGSTPKEIQQNTGYEESQVKNALLALESLFLVRRKFIIDLLT